MIYKYNDNIINQLYYILYYFINIMKMILIISNLYNKMNIFILYLIIIEIFNITSNIYLNLYS